MATRTLAIVAVLAAAACGGLGKDPAEGLNFRAPAGWDSSPSILGAHLYTSSAGDEFIILEELPPDVRPDQVFEAINVRNPREIAARSLTICKSETARETTGLVYLKNANADMRLDLITVARSGQTHAGAYLYAPTETPDLRAEASIRMLCPSRR